MEVDFQTKLKALEKVKTALANAPDLDIEKVNYRSSKIFVCGHLRTFEYIIERINILFYDFSAI